MPPDNQMALPPPPDIPQQSQNNAAPGMGGQTAQNPAPTHDQTVAALRHVHAVTVQLQKLLRDPDLGKSNFRSKIIDAMTALVSENMIPPAAAVQQLGQVPDSPFQQKQWLQAKFMQNLQMGAAVLAHHATAYAGQPEQPTPKRDNHLQDMQAMMGAHYGGGRNG
jgi:hypothetical protein